MENKINVSVAIAIFNEAKNLDQCLSSVSDWVKEIVVVDGGSTDDSISIAKRYNARIIVTDNPAIFHINKQKALDACRGQWILQLDADEVVSPKLCQEITQVIEDNPSENGFYIPRRNYFLGHWLRKGGQYPDYVIRLFQRGKGRFPAKSVHEQISIDGKVGYLKNPLLHYTYRSIGEYWRKANAYIHLEAEAMKEERLVVSYANVLSFLFIKPVATFFSLFVRHKGFIDGIYGFLFALFSGLHYPLAFIRYTKLRRNET